VVSHFYKNKLKPYLYYFILMLINPLKAELSPICHLLALLGAHHILHVGRIRINELPQLVGLHCLRIQAAGEGIL